MMIPDYILYNIWQIIFIINKYICQTTVTHRITDANKLLLTVHVVFVITFLVFITKHHSNTALCWKKLEHQALSSCRLFVRTSQQQKN